MTGIVETQNVLIDQVHGENPRDTIAQSTTGAGDERLCLWGWASADRAVDGNRIAVGHRRRLGQVTFHDLGERDLVLEKLHVLADHLVDSGFVRHLNQHRSHHRCNVSAALCLENIDQALR